MSKLWCGVSKWDHSHSVYTLVPTFFRAIRHSAIRIIFSQSCDLRTCLLTLGRCTKVRTLHSKPISDLRIEQTQYNFELCRTEKKLQLCVGNVINETIFGYIFNHTDLTVFEFAMKIVTLHMQIVRVSFLIWKTFLSKLYISQDNIWVLLVQAWPWTKHLPIIGKKGYREPIENIAKVDDSLEIRWHYVVYSTTSSSNKKSTRSRAHTIGARSRQTLFNRISWRWRGIHSSSKRCYRSRTLIILEVRREWVEFQTYRVLILRLWASEREGTKWTSVWRISTPSLSTFGSPDRKHWVRHCDGRFFYLQSTQKYRSDIMHIHTCVIFITKLSVIKTYFAGENAPGTFICSRKGQTNRDDWQAQSTLFLCRNNRDTAMGEYPTLPTVSSMWELRIH